jgi:NADH-ubiquinone oxidoreductase chain 5
MYILLIFLSFIGFSITGLFGRYIGSKGSALITTGCLFISFCLSIFAFYEVGLMGSFVYIRLSTWVNSEVLLINWGFLFDSLTIIMCVVVTFISLLVHLYSIEYMSHDPHLPRFMSYLSLFTFFMLILVTADNYIQMFLGWEGVGLCSFLLINFWFTRIQANKAAIKAMILNRIGDFCLIIGILLMYVNFKAVDYSTLASLCFLFKTKTVNFLNIDFNLLSLICVFLFLGAMGKSAQLGLHTWLPDAMEGPTPVSALIHAATMVTAGVFLIARSSFIYEYAPNVLHFVALLGAITALFASSVGLLQNDIKRVIAYSTCSQLGYMIFSCGLSNYSASIFHLSNHAFFKALLFLGAGAIIHSVNDEQDMRKMGGLKNLIPFTYSAIVIGSLALIGFPFLAGFYSKDLILELAYGKFSIFSHFSYFLGTFGAFLTAFYSTRLITLTFLVKPNGYKSVIGFAQETFDYIFVTLCCLMIPSIFVGYLTKDMIVGVGSGFFDSAIYTDPKNLQIFDAEFIDFFYKILPVMLSLIGASLSFFLYNFQSNILFFLKTSNLGRKIYIFLNKKWFFDKIYAECFSQFFFKFGYSISYKSIDRGTFEIIGPTGLSFVALKIANQLHKAQTGSLYHYALIILTFLSFLLCLRYLWLTFNYAFDYRYFILMPIIMCILSHKNKIIKMNIFGIFLIKCDAPEFYQQRLQDPSTTIMEGLLEFNKHLLFLIFIIVILVGWLLFSTMLSFEEFHEEESTNFFHSNLLEIIWTSLPAVILLILASPSFTLLYSMDEISAPELSLKVIGHQWFWSYEISDYDRIITCLGTKKSLKYTCYLLTEESISKQNYIGFFRLLETNKRLLLPSNTHIRVLVTSVDVLHSWTIPSFGIKIDACPGRLNQVNIFLKRVGVFFGQCSEICGVNHGFMPISLLVIPSIQYHYFVVSKMFYK